MSAYFNKENNKAIHQAIRALPIRQDDFLRLSNFIQSRYGIKMPPEKKIMLQSRLQKRLKALNLYSFTDYIDLVFEEIKSGVGSELNMMMNEVSTNKTSFFREHDHFDFIQNTLGSSAIPGKQLPIINILSAGSSSGEEAYSLAMVLMDLLYDKKISDYSITGIDISEKMLEKARQGIYPYEKHQDIPEKYKKKFLLKSKRQDMPRIRISPLLRQKVNFTKANLLQDRLPGHQPFDIIFCRNTLIYFEHDIQLKVLSKLINQLKTGGYILIGHSESLVNMPLPIVQVKPTIYQKINKDHKI